LFVPLITLEIGRLDSRRSKTNAVPFTQLASVPSAFNDRSERTKMSGFLKARLGRLFCCHLKFVAGLALHGLQQEKQ
jgi:hypothetical protein